ncbi:hypothetical protein FVE85_1133 [Porphyridium purpureum]|uniref:Uncharacterized protein n=1 Tax=Porphyridium purpureum TaxID=35688 RepID=A0A5J4Z3C9_PORPP|nr:hypothetical protein FVE85_1133 [Porphyridium purpureum]|eukprot:POR0965..scf208_2
MSEFVERAFGVSEQIGYDAFRAHLLRNARFVASTTPAGFAAETCEIIGRHGAVLAAGTAYVPSVAELHQDVSALLHDPLVRTLALGGAEGARRSTSVCNVVGEARAMHAQAENDGAVVQAASQFNLLEFPSPRVTPENGIQGYEFDRTQGPACAIACAAGTAYRNYLIPTPFGRPGAQRGQTAQCQINCLADIEQAVIEKSGRALWDTVNGYVESDSSRLDELNALLAGTDGLEARLKSLLRIGVQENTQVTHDKATYTSSHLGTVGGKILTGSGAEPAAKHANRVTQAYASALSIGYSSVEADRWCRLARVVLDGAYEATLLVGVKQTITALAQGKPRPRILLTKVGGGVFENKIEWIVTAMARAVRKISQHGVPLDIRVVHYGSVESQYERLATPPVK